ncbi:MAG: EVE domain-containing protein [Geobacter sp.]|jgi:predicted RNA-binding protein with PUA-like domain|nr:EVE domain-containing protein [Geobacter sp.]
MRHWLFKSEPGCFSFQDLQNRPDATEHWDGVRNFQARNFLRDEIKSGDRVLFYHSSIPEPAVFGLCTVVRDGYPDHTALDPAADHFDPKATVEKPIWYMVDVQADQPLPQQVPLAVIKEHPHLQQMPLVNRSRLSVQPLTETEFRIIVTLGGL